MGILRRNFFAIFLAFYRSYDKMMRMKVVAYDQTYRMKAITWSHNVKIIFIRGNVTFFRFWQKRRQNISILSSKFLLFCRFLRRTLTLESSRKFSRHDTTMIWVFKTLPWISSIQRNLNHCRTIPQTFYFCKSVNPPPNPTVWTPLL